MTLLKRLTLGALFVSSSLVTSGVALAQQAQGSTVEEIVVTGQRAAERAAIETKRESLGQVDAINANDVGKLPDQNVAEAVQRVAGVSVANDMGEGRYLIIRGVAPDLANVTINNQTAPAPEPDSRQVKLDDIPSSLLGAVRIIKTLTPDLDANAIAGQADIDTIGAFDKGRTFGSARIAEGYYDMNGKHPFEGDATVGGLFGPDHQFGAVLSANFSRRPIESQNVQGPALWPMVNGFRVPDDFEIRDYNLIRKRMGFVANFDWRPNDRVKTYLRTLYSKYEDKEIRDQYRVTIPFDDPSAFFNQTATSGSFNDGQARRALRDREEDDDTLTINGGGQFVLGVGKLDLEATYSRANKSDPRRNQFNFRGGKHLLGDYDTSDVLFTVTPEARAFDASDFDLHDIAIVNRKAQENLYQGRADYPLPIGSLGSDGYLKVGAKIIDRRKTNDESAQNYDYNGSLTLDQVQNGSRDSIYGGHYPFGPRVDATALYSYIDANPGEFELDTAGTIADSLAGDYKLSEQIYAGYVMANLHFGDLTLTPGVRIERTDGDYRGKSITAASTLAQGFDQIVTKSYTDIFPGVNARYDLTPDLVVRAAVTTAIGRPDYAQLAPFINVNESDEEVSLGNPDLKPLKALNFDASLEYYLPSHGLLSAAVFHKKIDHPIYDRSQTLTNVTYAGVFLPLALVTQPFNADDASVTGVEFNAQVEFGFLPSPLDGFGINTNLTVISSEVSGVPGHPDDTPLFGQSKRVASAQLFYEKYGFAARLAYSFRSQYLLLAGTDPTTDSYVADHGQLDARVAYDFNKTASVFVEGTNLTNEPYRVLLGGNEHLLSENEIYGWSVRAGVQLSF
jgi:TonB-dependent receptor